MKRFAFSFLTLLVSFVCVAQSTSDDTRRIREEFQDRKFGIFLHWGIYSMMGDGEWVMHNRHIDRDEYAKLAAGFYPSQFDAREWTKLFKEAGAKYVTFTSRHHDGFSMWPTKASPYNIVDATPYGKDVVKALAEACREQDLKLHFYYSHMDWQRTDYPTGSCKNCPHDPSTTNWESYYAFMNRQLTELLTNYGPIGAIWFDGMWDHKEKDFDWRLEEQYALIKRLQPNCLIGNNHHGQPIGVEDFQLFEQDLPGQNTAGFSGGQEVAQIPLETCMTMNNTWGYSITDMNYKDGDELIRKLVTAAGLNANFLLNIGPRPDGKLPDQAVERLKQIGEFMKANGSTIYGTRGGCVPPQAWGVTTQKGKDLFIHILYKVEDGQILLPLTEQKLSKVSMFSDGTPLKFKRDKEGYRIFLTKQPETIDCILKATLK
ncbi:MAG: alpha-L-fucosidase [Bacteroidaceae bacterium]|nr:alpha-L-fucosidase [Bacteroidaceae bacterium]